MGLGSVQRWLTRDFLGWQVTIDILSDSQRQNEQVSFVLVYGNP